MDASGVKRIIENIYPLPHIEYHKNETTIHIYEEEKNENSEGNSSGHTSPDDA